MMCLGPTGTGKTLAIADKLIRYMPKEYVPEFITFSAKTSANQTQDLIDGKLDKRLVKILFSDLGNSNVDATFASFRYYDRTSRDECMRTAYTSSGSRGPGIMSVHSAQVVPRPREPRDVYAVLIHSSRGFLSLSYDAITRRIIY